MVSESAPAVSSFVRVGTRRRSPDAARHRSERRWSRAARRRQAAPRWPDNESMRIRHEATYQVVYVAPWW